METEEIGEEKIKNEKFGRYVKSVKRIEGKNIKEMVLKTRKLYKITLNDGSFFTIVCHKTFISYLIEQNKK